MDRVSEAEYWIQQSPCPHLPMVNRRLTAEWTRAHRGRRDRGFYQASLEYGQSLWMEGKPAQAILQLNKAWSADLEGDDELLKQWPLPYRALSWMLVNAPDGGFLGNPVRHFQHLATRVGGHNAELRSWRAWACYYLSSKVLDSGDFPADVEQVESEELVIPEVSMVLEELHQRGSIGERDLFEEVMKELEVG